LLLQVAECKFLNNKLVDVVAFMENISVKDSMDKVCDVTLTASSQSHSQHVQPV
jgi:hypothetical protein